MHPRLFWTLLTSFALVIVLGICGMLTFIGLMVSGVWQPSAMRNVVEENQHGVGLILGDYYLAHGKSWDGLEQQIDRVGYIPAVGSGRYYISDENGTIVSSNDPINPVGKAVSGNERKHGIPIEANGQVVGQFVPRPGPPIGRANLPESAGQALVRSLLIAGAALGTVLLLLAAVLAGWITRPLRRVTTAADAVAAGQFDIQVHGARIRELNDLSHAFNRMSQALSESDRQRRQLVADVAHELRTPLSIVKGRLEGLQDGVYDATPEVIDGLLGETALLERLIEDLRLLALAEAGQLPLYPEPFAPANLLTEVASAFAEPAAVQGVTLKVEVAPDLPEVEWDSQRMRQVLGNIVSNALRYTPKGGTVTLCAELAVQALVIVVADTGTGIATEDVPYIFDRFYRADRARSRASGGTGLGLAIARQLIEAHGGTISATSSPGVGTTITMTMPLEMPNGR